LHLLRSRVTPTHRLMTTATQFAARIAAFAATQQIGTQSLLSPDISEERK
jgi:hypothetical protein